MLTKAEVRKKAEALLGEIWQAARSGAGRMGNDAEAALATLVLDQIEERDERVAALEHELSERDGTIACLRDEVAQLEADAGIEK